MGPALRPGPAPACPVFLGHALGSSASSLRWPQMRPLLSFPVRIPGCPAFQDPRPRVHATPFWDVQGASDIDGVGTGISSSLTPGPPAPVRRPSCEWRCPPALPAAVPAPCPDSEVSHTRSLLASPCSHRAQPPLPLTPYGRAWAPCTSTPSLLPPQVLLPQVLGTPAKAPTWAQPCSLFAASSHSRQHCVRMVFASMGLWADGSPRLHTSTP